MGISYMELWSSGPSYSYSYSPSYSYSYSPSHNNVKNASAMCFIIACFELRQLAHV